MDLTVKTSTKIKAPIGVVWDILTDFDSYPEWNPFITEASGRLRVGNQLTIKAGGMRFKPIVQTYQQGKSLSWLGEKWSSSLFEGHHRFKLSEIEPGLTQFDHSEDFRGLFVGLLKKKLSTDTKAGFKRMNAALKQRAELTLQGDAFQIAEILN